MPEPVFSSFTNVQGDFICFFLFLDLFFFKNGNITKLRFFILLHKKNLFTKTLNLILRKISKVEKKYMYIQEKIKISSKNGKISLTKTCKFLQKKSQNLLKELPFFAKKI